MVLISRRPIQKRGSGETVYKKFELWNVYWMTYTCLHRWNVYVMIRLIQSEQHQSEGAALVKRTQQK